ncbi:AMP-binding protein [Streptomonospora nanhaiensis]|uniref:AMP-binding protein n=1 Tax=Streptomonospora nanhaiensis TaxID=1323731 RepID=UPI001C3817DC|nr:AMP-binding protein [Streptomonospora nanhaiensis]MBV2365826.1 AMP-binding protein [Streptomonospora nanhaiensis]MBX9390332.1 AMP-binding protein [Streptomonospora nanhaiensis]
MDVDRFDQRVRRLRAPARARPAGSLTGGLADRLRRGCGRPRVRDASGTDLDALTFAVTVERAAAGLSRRGTCPDDVVGVLAPVGPERLTAVYTVMALGGIALPLDLDSDLETIIDVLTAVDARMILVTAPLAGIARELADRSRVRQVVAFGEAPETTPFGELLMPSPDGSGYDPARGLFDNGILAYSADAGGVRTALHGHRELLRRLGEVTEALGLGPGDTVAVDSGMAEPERAVLAAAALWSGASVVTTAARGAEAVGRELAGFGVTVHGSPAPARVAG